MSELKAFNMPRYAGVLTMHKVYLKSEADKVIAELKKEKQYAVDNVAEVINGQERELSHQKYKRCLAMARCCESELYQYPQFGEQSSEERRLQKWLRLWLAIAEKFKEAKK